MQLIQQSFARMTDRLESICDCRVNTSKYLLASHREVLEDPQIWHIADQALPSKSSPIGNLPADATRVQLAELSQSGSSSIKQEIDNLIGQIAKSILCFFGYVRGFADSVQARETDKGDVLEFQTSDGYQFRQRTEKTGDWATPLREVSSIKDCDGNELSLTSVHDLGDEIESLFINGQEFIPSEELKVNSHEYSERV